MKEKILNKNNIKKAGKKVSATVTLPILVYILLLIVCGARGTLFNPFTGDALKSILTKTSYMTIVAMGIGFQLKYGRFDFSGGAIIVVSATIGAVAANASGLGIWFLMLICVLTAVALSLVNATAYSWLKIPISVCSLAMAYFFEAIPGIVLGGKTGPALLYMTKYNSLGLFPMILIPLAIAVVLYFCYDKFTIFGKQSKLLAANQGSAVNIGINEKANTLITYAISGILFGLAGAIYATQNTIDVITSPLQTSGTLFSNIIPSLVGLFLSRFIDDSLGTFIGALTISLLYYGLESVGILSGTKTIYYAIFLAVFIFVSGFWDQIIRFFKNAFKWIVDKTKPKVKQS